MTRPKRLLVGTVGILLFLTVLAVTVVKVVFTKERILAILTPQLERFINRPVTIADAGITFWGGIGILLEGITVGNAPGFSRDPMISIGSIEIKARFWPLLTGHAVIDRVVIADPLVTVEFDASGKSNFSEIAKSDAHSDTLTSASDQRFTFGALIIDNARLLWRDRATARWMDLYGGSAEIEFNASNPQIPAFAATIVFDSLQILQGQRKFAVRAGNPYLYAAGSWNKPARTLSFDSTVVAWWGAKLTSKGQVRFLPSLYEVGFNSRLASVQVSELIREIDSAIPLPKFAELKAVMSGNFEARFVWPLPDNAVPDWQGRFELVDLRWPLPKTGATVTIPRVEIRGSDRSVSWSAPGGQITGGTFSSAGTIDQLFVGEETFSARVQANMPLEGTRGLLPDDWGSTLSGILDLDITGFGSIDDWKKMHINGRIVSDQLKIVNDAWDYDSLMIGLDCRLTGHGAQISRCDLTAGRSRGSITGRIENIIPSALSDFSLPDVPHGQFELIAQFLDLDQLVGGENDGKPSILDSIAAGDIPLLSLTGNVTADTVIYNKLPMLAVQSPFTYRDRVFSLSQAAGKVYGGSFNGRLIWNLNLWPEPEFFTSLSAESIEANDFFSRYFGWAGGVFGMMSISGEFSGRGKSAESILPTLLAQGRVDLSSTRLESAPLLAHIGRAIGISGLDRPRSLRDIRLPFRVESGRVITDEIRVTWDDVNYTAAGSFGLDWSLAYRVQAKPASDRAPRVVQGTGLRFSVAGTVTEPAVTIDIAGSTRDILDNALNQARDTLKQTLDQKLQNLMNPRKP